MRSKVLGNDLNLSFPSDIIVQINLNRNNRMYSWACEQYKVFSCNIRANRIYFDAIQIRALSYKQTCKEAKTNKKQEEYKIYVYLQRKVCFSCLG